ncbi:MAG: hypothetical protein QM760_00520 [Nibricoccus sp.]
MIGLLGSLFFISRTKPDFPVDAVLSPKRSSVPSVSARQAEAAFPAYSTEAETLPQSERASVGGNSASETKIDNALPPPPSGDYDLVLSSAQIAALIEARYGVLFQSLKLPPERVARLRTLLADRLQAAVDAANSSIFIGMDPIRDLSIIQHAIEEVQAPFDDTLRNELGESGFAAYREADRTLRERILMRDFAGLLATREPLQPAQESQLMEILKKSPGAEPLTDLNRVIYGSVNERARISDQAAVAAAAVLSKSQLEAFQELQRRWPGEK